MKLGIGIVTALSCLAANAQNIRMDASVPTNQARIFNDDLATLRSLAPMKNDAETLKIMGVTDLSPKSLTQWLGDRVQVIVGEKLDLKTTVLDLTKLVPILHITFTYPKNQPEVQFVEPVMPKKPSWAPKGAKDSSKAANAKVMMANIGAAFYSMGKDNKFISGMLLSDGVYPMTSPRMGVIQVGEGLFMPSKIVGFSTLANSLDRLSTLFHEARHSDGNGEGLTFAHSFCPIGHDYQGLPACDESDNGAYTVGALISKNFVGACKTAGCSTEDQEALRADSLDSFNRNALTATLKPFHMDGNDIVLNSPFGEGPHYFGTWSSAPEGKRSAVINNPLLMAVLRGHQ